MRYAGGLLGGTWVSLLAADLGAGKFDGAHLVQNFENLNPANTLWEKWYHLYANIDTEAERFLEFERWWGGFYLFNEEEIRWIVSNLFVGNKLSSGEARLGPGRYFDLKSIKQPIIIFASMGDNITPPQQAFNWIADVYSSTEEIKANGQTIVGLLHEDIGHLGIFVSGKVAKKEHAQIVEVLKYIQQLPPGLYGMDIEEHAQATTARSTTTSRWSSARSRTCARCRSTTASTRSRSRRWPRCPSCSSARIRCSCARSCATRCPSGSPRRCATSIRCACSTGRCRTRTRCCGRCRRTRRLVRAQRRPRAREQRQRARSRSSPPSALSAALDLYRDLRDATSEAAFFEVYGNMMSLQMADEREAMRQQAQVRPALDPGGARSARHARGRQRGRRPRAHRDADQQGGPRQAIACRRCRRRASSCRPKARSRTCPRTTRRRLLQEETIVVEFEPERAKRSLPKLLRTAADRRRAHALLEWTGAAAAGSRTASAGSRRSCARCCRCRGGAHGTARKPTRKAP